jgi:hypothetical protein
MSDSEAQYELMNELVSFICRYSKPELTVRASSSVAERPAPNFSTIHVATQPSGQMGSDLHGGALRGSPTPLGATYLEAEVRCRSLGRDQVNITSWSWLAPFCHLLSNKTQLKSS